MKKVDYSTLLMLSPILLAVYFGYVWQGYQLDDALIYLRYIKNFQEGHGLVYNPGERFNGLTSPFFTFCMLLGSYFVQNLQWLSVISSLCFLIATAYLSAKLFARSRYGEFITIVLIVSFKYFYTTIGMETTLFLFLIVLSLYLYKIDSDYFVITLALLVITRSEGIFLAAPICIDYVIRYKKIPKLSYLVSGLVLLALPFIFNKWYYGEFLAVTGSAKIGQGKSGFWGYGWIFLQVDSLFIFFSNLRWLAYALLVLAGLGAILLRKNKIALISLVFVVLLLGFYGLLNIPNYHWYYAPFFLFALIFASFAVEWFTLKCWQAKGISAKIFVILTLLVLIGFYFKNTMPWESGGKHISYMKIGEWLKANTPPNASVAMVEVGTVGWYADRRIIDILGLTNPYNADYIAKGDADSWPIRYQPDYILTHHPIWIHETVTKPLEESGAYAPVAGFNFPAYGLLSKTGKYSDAEIAQIPAAYKASQKK
jgi:arabinofuranosyltransferase